MSNDRSVTAYPGVDALVAFGPFVLLAIWVLDRTTMTETLAAAYVLTVLAYPVYRWLSR